MNKKYILGAGLSGLIYAFYHPEYEIISPEIGGKLSDDFMKHTILLHSTKETEHFLNDLGIKIKEKTHVIKYVKGKVLTTNISMVDKCAFIQKKLNDDSIEIRDIKMSTNDYYITILDVDFTEIIKKLKERVKIIDDKVIRITENKIVTEKTQYDYDEIVSTLPANIFWQLYFKDILLDLRGKPATYVLTDETPSILVGENFDLVYFIDSRFKYTRINKHDDNYLYEFTGKLTEEEIKKALPKHCVISSIKIIDNSIIYTNKQNIPPKNIKFLGRFAKWEHSYKIQDVIRDSQPSYDFSHIWNRQKSFYSKIINFNDINTTEQKEKETQMLLLHLFDEISEILNETNYKSHKQKKDVNVDKLKEECIDIQKYLLDLFILWGVDVREFVKLFNDKSDIVERRFEEEFKK